MEVDQANKLRTIIFRAALLILRLENFGILDIVNWIFPILLLESCMSGMQLPYINIFNSINSKFGFTTTIYRSIYILF